MYLEIDEGFPEHPKTLQLCASLESPTAFAYLINFWRWACRSCKDGDLRGMSVYAIEEAAKYHRHDGKLYQAMVAKLGGKAGFLDADENGVATGIHNWGKRTGAAIQRMEGEADRKRMYRAHKDGKCGHGCKWCETEGGQRKDGSGLSAGRPQDIPTQSSPVQSSQDKTREGDPPARDPGTTDTGTAAPPPLTDGKLLPDTADRLVMCLKIAMERARPELGMWHGGSFANRDAQMLLSSIGDPARAAKEIPPKIAAFVDDPSMHPWSMRKFCDQYNGIGAAKPARANHPVRPQARY